LAAKVVILRDSTHSFFYFLWINDANFVFSLAKWNEMAAALPAVGLLPLNARNSFFVSLIVSLSAKMTVKRDTKGSLVSVSPFGTTFVL